MTCHAPKRIALVAACPFPTSQGSQVFIHQLALSLHEAGHEVHVVTYGWAEFDQETPYPVHRITGHVPTRNLRAGPSGWKLPLDGLLAIKLFQICVAKKIQVIHAVNYEAALIGYIVRTFLRIPVLYHAHGLLELELPTYFLGKWPRKIAAFLGRSIEKILCAHADGIVALCRHDVDWIREIIRKGAYVRWINPGVRLDGILPSKHAGVEIESPSKRHPEFVYSGNLDRYQGMENVLDAFRLLLGKHPDARLVVMTGSHSDQLGARVRALGLADSVRILENLRFAETVSVIRQASGALVPRVVLFGFPIKLLNYLALGVPAIVCHSFDGLVHGRSVFVCKNTPEDLAHAMEALATDDRLRRRISEGGSLVVKTLYRWDTAVARIGEMYQKLLVEKQACGESTPVRIGKGE